MKVSHPTVCSEVLLLASPVHGMLRYALTAYSELPCAVIITVHDENHPELLETRLRQTGRFHIQNKWKIADAEPLENEFTLSSESTLLENPPKTGSKLGQQVD